MSTDALELLTGEAPTTIAEALKLKHLLEVRAECKFLGVQYHTNMHDRFAELRLAAHDIAKRFSPQDRRALELDLTLQISARISAILREFDQLDEEIEWSKLWRSLHDFHSIERFARAPFSGRLWAMRRKHSERWFLGALKVGLILIQMSGCAILYCTKLPFIALLFLVLRYKTYAANSVLALTIAISAWIALLAVLIREYGGQTSPSSPVLIALIRSWAAVFNISVSPEQSPFRDILVLCGGVIGLFHLGLLLTLITTKVLRK